MTHLATPRSLQSKSIRRIQANRALLFAGLASTAVAYLPSPWSGICALVSATIGLSAIVSWRRVVSGYGCFASYAAIWGTFHAIRARADNTEYVDRVSSLVLRWERSVFFGSIPSSTLQSYFYDPTGFHWYDYFLTLIYASFFVVPLAFAVVTICINRNLFFRYSLALATLFFIGCVVFVALPTMPPWMISSQSWNQQPHIERIAFHVMGFLQSNIFDRPGETLSALDANPLAAMPSIHTGVTMLFFLASRQYCRRWQIASLFYVVLMGIALVYLGEHSVLDVFAGILAAIAAWGTSTAVRSWLCSQQLVVFHNIVRSKHQTRSSRTRQWWE